MRAPIAVGVRKSSGVPATLATSPVGMRVESTGVYLSASIERMWRRVSPPPNPARVKEGGFERVTRVALSGVAMLFTTNSLPGVGEEVAGAGGGPGEPFAPAGVGWPRRDAAG